MKGTFRIGGAVFLGVLIILGAFWLRGRGDASETDSIVVAPAPERDAIATRDSDGDGVEDWAEALEASAFRAITPSTSTPRSGNDEPYEPPTTLTGKFSEAFLQDYLEGKMQGADLTDPTALVGSAVTAIEGSTKARRYTRLDIVRIPASAESVRAYGNELADIMRRHSIQNEPEAVILQRALEADSPTLLEPLREVVSVYEKILGDALEMGVPESLADEHLAFVNAISAIKTDVEAMLVSFTDPLYALARMRGYEADQEALYTALKGVSDELIRNGADYQNDEPGAFFYLFEQ